MPYTNIISRTDADALIPREAADEVIKATAQASAALQLCRTVRMSRKVRDQPVLSALPVSYWVADGGPAPASLKQTSEAAWAGVVLTAEELAVVVPVEDAVLADADYPVWDELREPLGQAFAMRLDAAVFAGTDKPASWPTAIIPGATAAGNVVVANNPPEEGGVYGDAEEVLEAVENDGFDSTAWAAARGLRGRIRKARSAGGELLGEGTTDSLWSLPISYAVAGSIPAPGVAVAGDFTMAVLGIRQDITVRVFTEGVITDDTGAVKLNLMQQDSSALRAVARYGFAVAVPATLTEGGGGTAYPFAVLNSA